MTKLTERLKNFDGFPRRFSQALTARGYTPAQFAKAHDIVAYKVHAYANGASLPGSAQLLFLAEALGVSTDWLLGAAPPRLPPPAPDAPTKLPPRKPSTTPSAIRKRKHREKHKKLRKAQSGQE